ncbi:MAG: hypothetical protein ACYDIC_17200 [Desulfobaccales bacterium]
MKKSLFLAFGVFLVMAVVVFAFAETAGTLTLKMGEEIYACNCGEKCPCLTLSRHEGKCPCGKDMVKAKVVKVGKDMVSLQAPGWEKPRDFKTVGKYACACGPKCNCDTISQKAGKCPCGKEMKEVKPMKKGV